MGGIQFTPENCGLIWAEIKTHSRRVMKKGQRGMYTWPDKSVITSVRGNCHLLEHYQFEQWVVGKSYAVMPGRGKPSWHKEGVFITPEEYRNVKIMNGGIQRYVEETLRGRGYEQMRIRMLTIRHERLTDMSREDAIAEGIPASSRNPVGDFAEEWNSIHKAKGHRFQDDLWVWVLGFKVVKDA